jgi:hypothetical protein
MPPAILLPPRFKLFDDDNTNKISFRNLARVDVELGEDDDEVQDTIGQVDGDGPGEMNVDESYRIMKKKGNLSSSTSTCAAAGSSWPAAAASSSIFLSTSAVAAACSS